MHPFHDYLAEHLDELLRKRSVGYDPRGDSLPRVTIGTAFLARHAGSFFGLRGLVEPIVAADKPEPLILNLPGVARDRAGSVRWNWSGRGPASSPSSSA